MPITGSLNLGGWAFPPSVTSSRGFPFLPNHNPRTGQHAMRGDAMVMYGVFEWLTTFRTCCLVPPTPSTESATITHSFSLTTSGGRDGRPKSERVFVFPH